MANFRWSLPDQTTEFLKANADKCENLSLLLDKLSPGLSNADKAQWLKFAQAAGKGQSNQRQNLMRAQLERWREFFQPYKDQQLYFVARTASPLIVGLGGGHVLETDITLDRNSGAPIIPGSALKGLARNTALIELALVLSYADNVDRLATLNALDELLSKQLSEKYTEEDLCAELSKLIDGQAEFAWDGIVNYRAVFGTVGQAGAVIFLDGLYADKGLPAFAIDIMNPHFGSYYTNPKENAPSDDKNPVPVTYLTVVTNQDFCFGVLPRQGQNVALCQLALKWLKTGLSTYGVGAKTAQGYGLFAAGKK